MGNKRSRHTASFQLSKFLNSKESLEYSELTGNSISILRYMFDVMDMNFNQTGKEVCNKSIPQIATYSRTSEKTVKRAIPYFIEHKFISVIERQPRKAGVYGIGDRIKAEVIATLDYPQANKIWGHGDPSTKVMVTPASGHGDPLVRSFSKKSYKTKSSTLSDFVFEPNEENILLAKDLGVDLQENITTFLEIYEYKKTQRAFSNWLKINKEHLENKKNKAQKSGVTKTQEEPYSAVNKMPFHQSDRTEEAVKRDLAPPPPIEAKPIVNWRERIKQYKQGSKPNGKDNSRDTTGNNRR